MRGAAAHEKGAEGLLEASVDVNDHMNCGARRLSDEGGHLEAPVEGNDGIVGSRLTSHVVDARSNWATAF